MGPFRESPVHLLVIVVLPLLAGLAALVRPRGARPLPLVPLAAATSLTMLVCCFVAAGPKAFLLSHVARLVRVGALDATFGFAATPSRALLAGAIAIAAIVLGAERTDRAPRLGVAASGALACALAEGFPTLLGGLSLLALAAATGAGDARRATRGLTIALSACAVVTLAAAASFWTLGGKFLDGRNYFSDYQPRFVAEIAGGQAKPDAKGGAATSLHAGDKAKLYMASNPGARIYLGVANEGQLRGRVEAVAESPVFGAEIAAALHKIAVDPGGGATIGGDGAEVALIDAVRATPGSDVILRLVGPTLTFDDIARQVKQRPELQDRTLGGSSVIGLVFALLGVAALAFAVAFASDDDPDMSAMGLAGGLAISQVAATFGGTATSGVVLSSFAPLFALFLVVWATWRRGAFAATSMLFATLAAGGVAAAAAGSPIALAALAVGGGFTALALRVPSLGVSVGTGVPAPVGPAAGLAASAAAAAAVSPIAGALVGVAWAGAAYASVRFRTFDAALPKGKKKPPADLRLRAAAALVGPILVVGSIVLGGGFVASLLPIVCALGSFAVAGAAVQLGTKHAALSVVREDTTAHPTTPWFDRVDALLTAPLDVIASRPRATKRSAP